MALERQSSEYKELAAWLQEAKRTNSLSSLIKSLEIRARQHKGFLVRLFLARAYVAAGRHNEASRLYRRLIAEVKPWSFLKTQVVTESKACEAASSLSTTNILASTKTADLPPAEVEPSPYRETTDRPQTPASASANSAAIVAEPGPLPGDEVAIPRHITELIQRGELEPAAGELHTLYHRDPNAGQVAEAYTDVLQRLNRYDDAITILESGIRRFQGHRRLALLNRRAQIASASQDWPSAIQAYKELVRSETRITARRFARIQLARSHSHLGQVEQARIVLDAVLKEEPLDQIAGRLRARLSSEGESQDHQGVEETHGEVDPSLETDLSTEAVELISPMLTRDIARAAFVDEAIIRAGGRPTLQDAERLLNKAQASGASEFGERYPLFLEAAKAFSELPVGTYRPENLHIALARYALLKGGAVSADLGRVIATGRRNQEELRGLRDTAASYILQSLALQTASFKGYSLIGPTNHLRTHYMVALHEAGLPIPSEIASWRLEELLASVATHHIDEIAQLAFEAFVAWGAAIGKYWYKFAGRRTVSGFIAGQHKERAFECLSRISNKAYDQNIKPGDLLRDAIVSRRKEIQAITFGLRKIEQLPLQLRSTSTIAQQWHELGVRLGPLLDTDLSLHATIARLLEVLHPYQSRSGEERTALLFAARTDIDRLLAFIDQWPTYWGRVHFEPLLLQWQDAIQAAEKLRLRDIQPVIHAELEPPLFVSRGGLLVGGLRLQNRGRGTASGLDIHVSLDTSLGTPSPFETALALDADLGPQANEYIQLAVPESLVSESHPAPRQLVIDILPRGNPSARVTARFTLEVSDQRPPLDKNLVPWNETAIPPEHLFKGREALVALLAQHLQTTERAKTYILYGLTRTGKSSILSYLVRRIDGQSIVVNGGLRTVVAFEWDLLTAKGHSLSRDMWSYLLIDRVIVKLEELVRKGKLPATVVPQVSNPARVRFRDWQMIIRHLSATSVYPVFLIDEFSVYRELAKTERLDTSFLGSLREHAIAGNASFVLAGTFDMRRIMDDPTYGVTGQFVNANVVKVSRIDRDAAIELARVMEPELVFTNDAIERILSLSYRIPYFIQIVCKYAAYFASESARHVIGVPELEEVVSGLVGESTHMHVPGVEPLPLERFQNNMHSPADPPEMGAILTTLTELSKGQREPRFVAYSEISQVWHRHGVTGFQPRLAQALQELVDREVLITIEDEGVPAYQISVDLFRRCWERDHRFLQIELDKIREANP